MSPFRIQKAIAVISPAQHSARAGSHDYWRSRSPEERIAAVEFRIVGRDAFVKNKKASGRLQDLADIESLDADET